MHTTKKPQSSNHPTARDENLTRAAAPPPNRRSPHALATRAARPRAAKTATPKSAGPGAIFASPPPPFSPDAPDGVAPTLPRSSRSPPDLSARELASTVLETGGLAVAVAAAAVAVVGVVGGTTFKGGDSQCRRPLTMWPLFSWNQSSEVRALT